MRYQRSAQRYRHALAVLAAVMPAMAGCSAVAAPVRLPTTSPVPELAAGTPAAVPVRQQVIDALTGYVAALSEAGKSRNPAEARRLLRPYLAADRIDGVVAAMSTIWARGEFFYGQDVLHIVSVTVTGNSAVVHDCDNTSGMGLEIGATGQPVPGSAGVPHENLATTLRLAAGRWLVQFQLVEDVPCTA